MYAYKKEKRECEQQKSYFLGGELVLVLIIFAIITVLSPHRSQLTFKPVIKKFEL